MFNEIRFYTILSILNILYLYFETVQIFRNVIKVIYTEKSNNEYLRVVLGLFKIV